MMADLASIAQNDWADAMRGLAEHLRAGQIHPARAVVLVPYAQLIQQAKAAWRDHTQASGSASAFVPRFETTMNWASANPGFAAAAQDIRLDAALDALTAASLLKRAGLATQQSALVGRLIEAAVSVARLAAAQKPADRLAWGARMALELSPSLESPALALELAVARIALAWAASSGYPSDVLFDSQASSQVDALVVIEGFQSDALTQALKLQFGNRSVSIQLNTAKTAPKTHGLLALHTAADLEDEAHQAAACVLTHLAAGRSPVALVAQDRLLTRRISALLGGKGVALRDETGWKLSTTRAAAALVGLLRALPWDASTDAVLDWLKNAPAFDAADVTSLEAALRKIGIRHWRALPSLGPEAEPVVSRIEAMRSLLQKPRPLADWLTALRAALESSAQWAALATDAAGAAVMAALHMGQDADLPAATLPVNPRFSLQDFSAWVNQALEAASFAPPHPAVAQVVILPLSQLLGRPMQAVVLPGCDELRLQVSPEPPGPWTKGQRALLGLPSRNQLADAQRAAWQYALCAPQLDLLWRLSEGGETVMPSGFVQELQLQQALPLSRDARPQRWLTPAPTHRPLPTGQALPVTKLSASAYEDLRRCPYRFFALRQLKLQESDELESELGKRDFGNWLHLLLHHFQNALQAAASELSKQPAAQQIHVRTAMINIAADAASQKLGLSPEEFLPFAASWPRVRSGYLDWLAAHEASGATFADGEVWRRMPLGGLELVGKIDRIDQLPGGGRLVMDYKTEPAATTKARIVDAAEDTQLAFYAALLDDDTLAAAYVNLGESQATKTYAQPQIVELRDDLIGGILSDMAQLANGAPLPALGEGKACEFCAARGLCRRDFWKT